MTTQTHRQKILEILENFRIESIAASYGERRGSHHAKAADAILALAAPAAPAPAPDAHCHVFPGDGPCRVCHRSFEDLRDAGELAGFPRAPAAAPAKVCEFTMEVTDETGLHTGRRRYRVTCRTCDVELHEATTGPMQQVNYHLRAIARGEVPDPRIRPEAVTDQARAELDGVYTERTRLIALLAALCRSLGYEAGLGVHDPADLAWDPAWRTVVFIHIPNGLGTAFQCSWHIADRDRALVEYLPTYQGVWDGHTTAAKYAAIAAAVERIDVTNGAELGHARDGDPRSTLVLDLLADMVEWGSWGDGVPDELPGFERAIRLLVGQDRFETPDGAIYKVPAPVQEILRRRREANLAARRAASRARAGLKVDALASRIAAGLADRHAENTTYHLERTSNGGLQLHRTGDLRDPLTRYRPLLSVHPLDVSDLFEVIAQMMPQPASAAP